MHDYIFHHQHTLEDTDLTRFAGAVGLQIMSYFHAFVSGGAIYGDWTRLSRAFADFIGMACPTIPMKPISYF